MPPRKPKSGAAGRAKRKQITQAAELNLDTAGASDALAAALRRVSTAAIGMRKKRTPRSGQHTVCGYTIRRRRVKNTTTLHFSHKVCARVVGYSSVHVRRAPVVGLRGQAEGCVGADDGSARFGGMRTHFSRHTIAASAELANSSCTLRSL